MTREQAKHFLEALAQHLRLAGEFYGKPEELKAVAESKTLQLMMQGSTEFFEFGVRELLESQYGEEQ